MEGSEGLDSYPGPDRSVSVGDLKKDRIVSRRYRNRRLGDFLKELDLTEGRSTGIPKMREAMRRNGSPRPRLVTDEDRTFFRIELPVHPTFRKAHDEAHDEAHDGAPVTLTDTERQILETLRNGPRALPDIATALNIQGRSGHLKKALARLTNLGLVRLTIPDKPRSKKQQRQLTARGRQVLGSPASA